MGFRERCQQACDHGFMNSVSRDTLQRRARAAVNRLNRHRVYRARHGIGRGFLQVGGVGLVLPTRLSAISGFVRHDAEERFLRQLPLEGSRIYDVGAFRGVTTLFFARNAGPTGHVVAFEPHPQSCRCIRRHLDLNGIANVTLRNVAVGAAAGELELIGPQGGDGTTSGNAAIQRLTADRASHTERRSVPVVSIDDEVRSYDLSVPDFIKIDVEGMELDVLRGMRETIARWRPRLFVEIHGVGDQAKRENAANVVALMTEHGYALHHVESDRKVTIATSDRSSEGHLYCDPIA
ncbi:MAG: FkbM family methyltransferase [Solirubrobacteraceae bacterium]